MDQIQFSDRTRSKLGADANALLCLLSNLADYNVLMEIAKADYGYKGEENFKQLKQIRDTGILPSPLVFELKEVLELTCWTEPEHHGWKPGSAGHIACAFACVVLLKAGGDPANQDCFEGENSSMARLITSLDVLGSKYQEAAVRLFAWRLENLCNAEDPPFLLLAILRNALKVWPDLEPEVVLEIVDLLLKAEKNARNDKRIVIKDDAGDQWLFGLTHFDTKEHIWCSFSDELQRWAAQAGDERSRERVLYIAHLLIRS